MRAFRTPHITLTEPPADRHVQALECCPAFTPREGTLPTERECWFCRYADFRIDTPAPSEDDGVCNYGAKKNIL